MVNKYPQAKCSIVVHHPAFWQPIEVAAIGLIHLQCIHSENGLCSPSGIINMWILQEESHNVVNNNSINLPFEDGFYQPFMVIWDGLVYYCFYRIYIDLPHYVDCDFTNSSTVKVSRLASHTGKTLILRGGCWYKQDIWHRHENRTYAPNLSS